MTGPLPNPTQSHTADGAGTTLPGSNTAGAVYWMTTGGTIEISEPPDLLLWVDLETTGSNEHKDCIVEIGAILTTTDLEEIAECSLLVRPTPEGLGRMLQNGVVRPMHEANGLLAAILDGPETELAPIGAVASFLLRWLKDNGAHQGRVVLAGSGVGHFDRRFIRRWLPDIDRWLRYWPMDVGVIRRAHDLWVGTPVSDANDRKTHRALDDVRCHLEEARAFKALWRGHEWTHRYAAALEKRVAALGAGIIDDAVLEANGERA